MRHLKLTINDTAPLKGHGPMEVRELKDSLSAFNPKAALTVAIPSLGEPHKFRLLREIGHLDHPGKVKTDHSVHALDLVCDHFDTPDDKGGIATIGDFDRMLKPFPDPMHVRVAVPVAQDSHSHRMLDIIMLGHATGGGPGVQIVTENWDNPMQVIKELR